MSPADRLRHVVVAIPARDEQALLPACLRSVRAAATVLRRARPGIRLSIAVALDGAEALAAWHARHQRVEGHAHVHGANLGIRADRWRAVGRFGRLTVGEDVDLVEWVRAATDRWVATDTTRVLTPGPSHSRVEHGFAGNLHDLDAETG